MPSAEINKDISSLAPEAGTEAGAQVLRRLTVVLLWTFALWGIVMAYVFWQMPHTAEVVQTIDKTFAGPATHGPEIPKPFTIKLTGFFLLSNVLGVTLLHALAPRAVVRNRLISNSLFSLLIICLCAAVTMVSHMLPELGMVYFKSAVAIAFQPQFLAANAFVIILFGAVSYKFRNEPLFDITELYWNLGLSLLVLLAVALVLAVI